jgi:hypothetical protein
MGQEEHNGKRKYRYCTKFIPDSPAARKLKERREAFVGVVASNSANASTLQQSDGDDRIQFNLALSSSLFAGAVFLGFGFKRMKTSSASKKESVTGWTFFLITVEVQKIV